MKTFFKYLFSILTLFLGSYLIYLNVKLYYTPEINECANNLYNNDVVKQLNFIKSKVDHHLGEDMQQIYPEGYFFSHVLYGLALSETKPLFYGDDQYAIDAPDEIDKELECLYSDKGTRIFPRNMKPAFGIFYAGWTNYLLAKKLTNQIIRDSSQIRLFEHNCDGIYQAFLQNKTPYLESYKGLSWPADNVVAIASLALHDKILTPKYQTFISGWLTQIKKYLDKDGLIPHKVDYQHASIIEAAKGSSQSLMLCFLHDIDTVFARQQFNLYKKLFVNYRFGLPGIREHKKGISKDGDIDSGPVILDIGGSASVVGLKTMSIYNETELMVGLRNSIEAFGMAYSSKDSPHSFNNFDSKKYLFGQIPIADCFIAWSNVQAFSSDEDKLGNWRWKFQLISFAILLLLSGFNYWLYRKTN